MRSNNFFAKLPEKKKIFWTLGENFCAVRIFHSPLSGMCVILGIWT